MLALFWSQWSHPQTNFPSLNEKWICRVEWLTPHNFQESLDSDDVRPRKLLCTFNDKQMREKENEKEKYSWIQTTKRIKNGRRLLGLRQPTQNVIHTLLYLQTSMEIWIYYPCKKYFSQLPWVGQLFFWFCSFWYCHLIYETYAHIWNDI